MCKLFISGGYLVHRVGEREWLKKKHNTDEKFQILRSVIKSFYFVVGIFFFFGWLFWIFLSVPQKENSFSVKSEVE